MDQWTDEHWEFDPYGALLFYGEQTGMGTYIIHDEDLIPKITTDKEDRPSILRALSAGKELERVCA